MQQKIKEIYRDSPIADFSLHYPFTIEQLVKWADILSWEEVSSNRQVDWSGEIIRKFADRWDWQKLWTNKSVFCWDAELLEEFGERIAWNYINVTTIEWTQELHSKFGKYLPQSLILGYRSNYDYINDRTYRNRHQFIAGSRINNSKSFLELYRYAKLKDEGLGVYILFDAIQEYFDSSLKTESEIIYQKTVPKLSADYKDDIAEAMQDKIQEIGEDTLTTDFSRYYPFTISELEKWDSFVYISQISSNTAIKWSREIIFKYAERLFVDDLLCNDSILCWDAELLNEFYRDINFRTTFNGDSLLDTSISWTPELHSIFERYIPEPSWSFDVVKEETYKNRIRNIENPNLRFSESFFRLYNFAKSLDKDRFIFIIYDAIRDYFDNQVMTDEKRKMQIEVEGVFDISDPNIFGVENFNEKIKAIKEKISDIYKHSPIAEFSQFHPFQIYHLEEWAEIVCWKSLSSNRLLMWSGKLIRKFADKWDWYNLWTNKSVFCWDASLLEEFKNRIPWSYINESSVHWTEELHSRFDRFLPSPSYSFNLIKVKTHNNRCQYYDNLDHCYSKSFSELILSVDEIDSGVGELLLILVIEEYFKRVIIEMKWLNEQN